MTYPATHFLRDVLPDALLNHAGTIRIAARGNRWRQIGKSDRCPRGAVSVYATDCMSDAAINRLVRIKCRDR